MTQTARAEKSGHQTLKTCNLGSFIKSVAFSLALLLINHSFKHFIVQALLGKAEIFAIDSFDTFFLDRVMPTALKPSLSSLTKNSVLLSVGLFLAGCSTVQQNNSALLIQPQVQPRAETQITAVPRANPIIAAYTTCLLYTSPSPRDS